MLVEGSEIVQDPTSQVQDDFYAALLSKNTKENLQPQDKQGTMVLGFLGYVIACATKYTSMVSVLEPD